MIWLKMTDYWKTRITNSQDLNMACNKESLTFLPSANEVAVRECFYTCLSFCSHGGGSVCPIACWDTHPQADTPRADSSPRQTSPGRHHPADTPPGRHPSQQTPLPAETPPADNHLQILRETYLSCYRGRRTLTYISCWSTR